jgi:hypothetical protein
MYAIAVDIYTAVFFFKESNNEIHDLPPSSLFLFAILPGPAGIPDPDPYPSSTALEKQMPKPIQNSVILLASIDQCSKENAPTLPLDHGIPNI